ncbi:C69 family dipeptidase [Leptospira vanthielii]|uniref:Dipeptidase n=2 Tax=Leptospira vanthielii TaxID=293085 RepID=A0ABY2NTW6_9LEPT|nr:C69 family dipeptidase [Leptospira vanthielii]EMY68545.1 peptidase, C69 family [Leptospira vanthielii serovar Holland str. Waz Holland = ATCC 700522]TGM61437.1 peptidase C69 [Leptospira vanthielii]
MCDTSLATEKFTKTQKRIFAKNSDREPNESQSILHVPRLEHKKGSLLRTTYIEIPQTPVTYEVFLSKPFHMWGAEMGVNEFGLCIGNEAVFTNLKISKRNNGLTGMDLIRLALERCKSAKDGLFLITELLETYGQDACGGYENKSFFYHNSFIIADRTDGYVLETADRYWVAKKIDSFYAISNGLTIGSDFDYSSPNLIDTLRKNSNRDFSFKDYFSDQFYTYMSHCKDRKKLHEDTAESSEKETASYTAKQAMETLKTHFIETDEFEPSSSSMKSLCLHATGPTTPNQTNGSLIVEWDTSETNQDPLRVYYTGTSTPCLSLFKPFYFGTKNFIGSSSLSSDKAYSETLWWLHESIARKSNFDYQAVRSILVPALIGLQESVFNISKEFLSPQKKEEVQWRFLKDHVNILKKVDEELIQSKIGRSRWQNPLFQIYWSGQNRKLGIPFRQ